MAVLLHSLIDPSARSGRDRSIPRQLDRARPSVPPTPARRAPMHAIREGIPAVGCRGSGTGCGEHHPGLAHPPGRDQLVQLPEDERLDLADLHAGRRLAASHALDAPVALDGDGNLRARSRAEGVEGEDVEGADHGAHRTADALALVHQHQSVLLVAVDRARRAHLQARRRVAVAAAVGEGEGGGGSCLHVDPLAGDGGLEEGQRLVLALRVLDCAGELALEASDAPLGIDEHRLHDCAITSSTKSEHTSTLASSPVHALGPWVTCDASEGSSTGRRQGWRPRLEAAAAATILGCPPLSSGTDVTAGSRGLVVGLNRLRGARGGRVGRLGSIVRHWGRRVRGWSPWVLRQGRARGRRTRTGQARGVFEPAPGEAAGDARVGSGGPWADRLAPPAPRGPRAPGPWSPPAQGSRARVRRVPHRPPPRGGGPRAPATARRAGPRGRGDGGGGRRRLHEVRDRRSSGVPWLARACGACQYCRSDRENLCSAPHFTGWDTDGGFADAVVCDEEFAYHLPDVFSDAQAAPLLCAGIIGYRALKRSRLPAEGRLGIYGFGGSAHLVAQVALAQGARVHVMTRSDDAKRLALELGVQSAVAPSTRHPSRSMRRSCSPLSASRPRGAVPTRSRWNPCDRWDPPERHPRTSLRGPPLRRARGLQRDGQHATRRRGVLGPRKLASICR